ncbi:MAG: hypothetical protein HY021_02720 [Burkholderiales bacterium]|nr:hypothetical protein [Burkholderiales bacterium]
MTPRRELGMVLCALVAVCDAWEMADGFTQSNRCLAGNRPSDVLGADQAGVLKAAYRDRSMVAG